VYCIDNFSEDFAEEPNCNRTHGFLGVVSTVPITSMLFNENNDGDDIFVRDFEFGYLEWEP
jgi:hypothetical protein